MELILAHSCRWQATTIPSSVLGLVGGISYFGSLESTGPIFGIDPMIVYGAASVGCMGEHKHSILTG